ncbi:MAG: polysaccharide deacetylase family protein [Firmicutes bacterium]|nr:polysaccharide deacetylase family protein [Bacillota bacterium]
MALIILILVIVLICVVACGKKDKPKDPDPNGGTSVIEPSGGDPEPGNTGDTTDPEPTPQKPPKKTVTDAEIAALSPTGVTWGPGRQFDENDRPIACVDLEKKYDSLGADFVHLDESSKGKIYLTFDEGYENGFTPPILDTLKEKGVSAVFFCTGHFVKSEPELIQRMIDEGHVVGNHTMNHPNMVNASLEKAKADILELHDYILDKYNYEMDLFRFPEGEFSEQTLALVEQCGYRSIFWSFAYADWDPANQWTQQKAKDYILEHVHDGEIMLLHAVSETNAAILGDVIDAIRAMGFEFAKYPGY